MKRTIRDKNTIVITFLFYLILVLGLLVFFSLNLVGKITNIEEKKISTQKILKEVIEIENKGLNYEQFKKMSVSSQIPKESKEILKNIGKEFFDKNFKNNTNGTFTHFMKIKNNELNSPENTKLILDNEKQIISILPTYSEGNISIGEHNLSDLAFVNYIESILESFSLLSEGAIGIGKVVLINEYANSSSQGETLDSNIYYIPLNMNISGTKENILNFLYFIEKVGNIDVHNNKISIKNDSKQLDKNGFKKILAGDKYSDTYNIFEHQIIDITDIKMPDYIDSSYLVRNNIGLSEFVINNQGDEDFSISVNLLFYVKGQPKYVIINFINNVINNIKSLGLKVNGMLGKNSLKGIELLNLKKKQKLLQNLNKKAVILKKGLRQKENLENTYKSAVGLSKLIDPLCKEFIDICK